MQFQLMPFVAVSILAAATHADTLDVCQSGCTYSSIQDAIDAASPGDRIEIGPGTYYEHLVVNTADLTIIGLAGRELTFVDGQASGRCLWVAEAAGTTEITGLTFQFGYRSDSDGDSYLGAGIHTESPLYLRDSTVRKCVSQHPNGAAGAGGIYLSHDADGTVIQNVIIQGNRATGVYVYGGGIYSDADDTQLLSCTISDNWLTKNGNSFYPSGAAISSNASRIVIANCIITNNQISNVAGYQVLSVFPFFMDNTLICGECTAYWGAFGGSNNLLTSDCNTASGFPGACCTESGCSDLNDQMHCLLIGGVYAGPYTSCDTTDCDTGSTYALGACCLDDNCAFIQQIDCLSLGGQWNGPYVTCESAGCATVPATGACCVGDTCQILTMDECFALPGFYAGDGSGCDAVSCPEVCAGDLNHDNEIGVSDLLILLDTWGSCP